MSKPPRRLLRIIALCVLIPGFLGWFYAVGLSNSYASLPQKPDPSSGRIYPRGIHGLTVYQTRIERDRLTFLLRGSAIVSIIGFAMAVFEEQKWKRLHPKNDPPANWKPL